MAEWGKPERRNTIESLQGVNISFRDKALKVSQFLPETRNLKKVYHFPKKKPSNRSFEKQGFVLETWSYFR